MSAELYPNYVIVPDASGSQVLLRVSGGGWSLPPIDMAGSPRWWARASDIRREVRRKLALDATLLRCQDLHPDQRSGRRTGFFVMEPLQLSWARPPGTDWFGAADVEKLSDLDPDHAEVLARYFARSADAEADLEVHPWTRPGWFNRAVSWLEATFADLDLRPAGTVQQLWCSPWSCVLSVPSAMGALSLKACCDRSAHEPELTQALAQDFPDLVPGVHAVDPKRRFLLMEALPEAPDFSAAVGQPESAWAETLVRALIAMQTAYASSPSRLLDLGCPDRSPEGLLRELDALFELVASGQHPAALLEKEMVHRLGPHRDRYGEGLRELAAGEVPATLGHPRLDASHVALGAGGARIISWSGELTHPFFCVNALLDDVASEELRARLREIYLAGWLDWAPAPRLDELFERSKELGLLARALAQLSRLRVLHTPWEREVERAALLRTLDRLDAVNR